MEPINPEQSGEQRPTHDEVLQTHNTRNPSSRSLGIKAIISAIDANKSETGNDSQAYAQSSGSAGSSYKAPHTSGLRQRNRSTQPLPIEQVSTIKTPSMPLSHDDDDLREREQRTEEVVAVGSQAWPSSPLQPARQEAPNNTSRPTMVPGFQPPPMPFPPQTPQPFIPLQLPPPTPARTTPLDRGKALLLIALLGMVVLQALNIGPGQFLGSEGWAYVLGGPGKNSRNLLKAVQNTHAGTKKAALTPDQYIDSIIGQMTLDEKIGQMMMVQFTGPSYSLPLSTMINQYHVGSVLILAGNGNILDQGMPSDIKNQLISLTQQMQQDSTKSLLPLGIAIDQEGGAVDRLIKIDGPQPSEATIGASNNPQQAFQVGQQDAQELASYGINVNLAPVVDVGTLSSAEVVYDGRTYGSDPTTVTNMASSYLQGLQQSGQVVGTLKHFPNLGAATGDPHVAPPYLYKPRSTLEQIDWAPYRALIQQNQARAILVTHEYVTSIDSTEPASLSPKLVQGVLRDEMGFQGVIMTDSLSMGGLRGYTEAQAAALAVQAGSDIIMGASSPDTVAAMIDSIKQAITAGTITQQQIDQSVHRILMMKYGVGLITLPKNTTQNTTHSATH